MARTSRTPFVVLGILGILRPKPVSGYDIKQVIEGTISHFWSESYGQIYPVLKQLAAEKLIRAAASKEDGRKKVLYTITAKGEKRLQLWLEKPPEPGPQRDELVLKLFFGNMTSPEVLIRHLLGFRNRLQATLEQYTQWLQDAGAGKQDLTVYQLITLRGGVAMAGAFVNWADQSMETLRKAK
jgi:DNA-binding PadR family transcriptional regulator